MKLPRVFISMILCLSLAVQARADYGGVSTAQRPWFSGNIRFDSISFVSHPTSCLFSLITVDATLWSLEHAVLDWRLAGAPFEPCVAFAMRDVAFNIDDADADTYCVFASH